MTAKPSPHTNALLRLLFRMAVLFVVATPAIAWNAAGHRISALLAWERMDEATKSTVAAILRKHPDFERWQTRAFGADPDRTAFLEASTWPDEIRKDKRFYTRNLDEPTETQAGFPDMERRRYWHYVDRPLRPGASTPSSPGTLDRQLVALARTLGDRKSTPGERAYALPWLIHLVSDAHQPLHAASRYGPDGESDDGGNRLNIINPFAAHHPSMSLHRYWDDLPGPPWLRGSRLDSAVMLLSARYPQPIAMGTPEQWLDESWHIARQYAYPPAGEAVPTISVEFHERAQTIARRRVTEAGYRLADLLRQILRADNPRAQTPRH